MKNEEVIIINNNNGKKNENINKIRKEEEEEENKIKIIKKRKISINKKLLKKYIDNLNYSINKLKEIVDSYCE